MSGKPVIQIESALDQERRAWVYRARGKLIGCQLCYDFLEQARDRIDEGAPHVVVDLSAVTMLNSTGIGIIASLHNSTRKHGGKVYLVGTADKAIRPLIATHVWEFLGKCNRLADLPATL